jgi:hypothetical protein
MRTVLIRIEDAKRRVRKLQLSEGARVSDILQELNVPEGYILARSSEPTRPFPHEAELHPLITDAEYLIARPSSVAVENADPLILTLSN